MKKIFNRRLLVLFMLVTAMASCSKTNKQGLSVPKEAAYVVHINGKTLSEKLPWEEIRESPAWSSLSGDTAMPAFAKRLMENPENSGIDHKNDISFFMVTDSVGAYTGVTGVIRDVAKFEMLAAELLNGGSSSEKDGIKYISAFPRCLGWNKDKFILINDSGAFGKWQVSSDDNLPAAKRDIGAACRGLFALKEGNSLGSDEKFSELVTDRADVHIWINGEMAMRNDAQLNMLSMFNPGKLYEGNINTLSLSFEEGKIHVHGKWYNNKDLAAILKKYEGGAVSKELVERLPAKDLPAVIAMNYKPEGIKEILKLTGMDGLINLAIMQMGFSIDDFTSANKGNMLLALTDLSVKADSVTYDVAGQRHSFSKVDAKPSFIFSAEIKDKEAFAKLMKAGKKAFEEEMQPGDSNGRAPSLAYSTDGKYFVLGNDKGMTDDFLAGKNVNKTIAEQLGNAPITGFANFQLIFKGINPEVFKDSTAKVIYDLSVKMWDKAQLRGGNMKDGALVQDIDIFLLDTKTNSLRQLNTYFGKIVQLQRERREKREVAIEEDMVSPPAVKLTPNK